jgi:glycosyltransferase involved in cell wall biosynthesis
LQFSKAILPVARKLQATEKFDVVHHVTFSTWRVASPLWQLGLPFVFGPVGGYEQFPWRLFSILSPAAAAFELARMASNVASRFSPGVRRCLRNAAHVLVANAETEQLVKSLRRGAEGITTLSAGFFAAAHIQAFARFAPGKTLNGPLRLFAAGNMEGRKGISLAFAALAEAKKNGVKFQYRLGAQGPEIAHLKRLANRLGLTDEIIFGEGLRGEAYQRELGNTHIFLLPSFRESAGLTMMEAMLAGCVPVVADCGGPGLIVSGDCGFKIPVSSRAQMVKPLADAIVALDRDRQLIGEKGRLASERIAENFSEDNYLKQINAVYQSVAKTEKPVLFRVTSR